MDFSLPICLRLTDVKISDIGLEATILNTNQKIKAEKTDNPENIEKLKKHKKMILSSDILVKQMYWSKLESEITFEVVKFLYYDCWE